MSDMFQAYVNSRTSTNTMFDIFWIVITVIGCWKMFEKANQPGWMAIVPILDLYKLFEIAWGNGLLFLLLFIPGINIVVIAFLCLYLARAFGKSNAFAVGLFFLGPVFYAIIGFGSAQYCGPKGLGGSAGRSGFGGYGSRRTGTVDFDVKRNDPVEDYQNAQTVDFDVKQNDK